MDGSVTGNEFPAKLDDLLLGVLDGLVRCDTVLYWRDQQGTHDPQYHSRRLRLGLAGTFTSFIILGNYGLAQQLKHGLDITGFVAAGGDYSEAIMKIFDTLPLTEAGLILLAVTMIAFYSTTFDALTMVVSSYSYKRLKPEQEPDKRVRTFWAVVFILLPIALIFSENSMHSLQSVSIIAAFPIGITILMIVASFFKDASGYLQERKDTQA